MDKSTVEIKPFATTPMAVTAKLSNVNIQFGEEDQYAMATLDLIDADGRILQRVQKNLTKYQCDSWGEDDEYIVNLILGMTSLEKM